MKKTLLAIAVSTCFIYACSNSNNSTGTTSDISKDSALENTAPTVSETINQLPVTDSGATLIAPVAPSAITPQPATTTAAGMNPEHGQPGHRCDIAVGAPLNSPPAATAAQAPGSTVTTPSNTPALTTPSSTVTPAVTAQPTTTAPGMNPPHGQPGHDCAIAVGAPLKKK